jgi:hypothetical protein
VGSVESEGEGSWKSISRRSISQDIFKRFYYGVLGEVTTTNLYAPFVEGSFLVSMMWGFPFCVSFRFEHKSCDTWGLGLCSFVLFLTSLKGSFGGKISSSVDGGWSVRVRVAAP